MLKILVVLSLIVIVGLPYYKIDITEKELYSSKIKKKLRIGVLADLHSTQVGKNQNKLCQLIEHSNIDVLVIPGDLLDDRTSDEPVFTLLKQLEMPMYYVDGNHEQRYPEYNAMWKEKLPQYGVKIIEDTSVILEDYGVEIAGIPCMRHTVERDAQSVNDLYQTNNYRILLSHIPSYITFYKEIDCDLIIGGHAHGGQWRIPFTHQGVFSPSEGIFPKYTEGLHSLGKQKLFISRGLNYSARGIPRLFNNPEFSIIELTNTKE